ncbi:ABC transporter ATP-binding protein [Clostridium beijerinckii]|uniref:Daunorubicin/doxorubicin resistance ATP-binding protein DrrA n=1 Tax=Clostridium beijerinckii TaxID=1520 RepID=A0A1S8SJY2_CLOBE|nr:ATP-binding cassette domain-containing protein [Clostridium beijerinckii]NRY61559.1 ABC-2 type transport system ATP-binding protein [Clostridium beijerinckii]OOM65846.1 daunorubicin/doxorubicin resistance ATP-binding protein DrrA [Clostridium beijerinckii]
MHAIEVSNLTKKYEGFTAVDKLTFSVPQGQIFGLLGPNGSGKTTTINMLCGLIKCSEGNAKILGFDVVSQLKEVRKVLGVVPQETALYDSMTAQENLDFHAALYGVSANESRKRVNHILELVGLKERYKSRVGTFSGGMKRRLALGRALLSEPQVIFLDEPSLGVDVQSRMAIWEHIVELKKKGISILITTNYMEEADYLADSIAIIDKGKLITVGSPSQLKAMVGEEVIEIITDTFSKELEIKLMEMENVEKVQKEGNVIYLTVKEGAKTIIPVIDAFKQSAISINSFSLKKVSLNEAFLQLTGKSLRD